MCQALNPKLPKRNSDFHVYELEKENPKAGLGQAERLLKFALGRAGGTFVLAHLQLGFRDWLRHNCPKMIRYQGPFTNSQHIIENRVSAKHDEVGFSLT